MFKDLINDLAGTGHVPAGEQDVQDFAEACRRVDTDPREKQRIREITDLVDAEVALYGQAVAALGRSDHDTAVTLLRRAAEKSIGDSAWLLAVALDERGETAEAITWYRRAAQDGDSRAEAALAEAATPPDRVDRQLPRAVSESGGSTEPTEEWMLDWLADIADQLIRQEPKTAAEVLGQAVASFPAGSAQHILLSSRLADALYRVGDRAAAEQVADHAMEQAVGSDLFVDLLWTLIRCRMLEGKSAEALATLTRALASPGLSAQHHARLLTLAARTYLNLGEAEMAAQVAAKALKVASEAGDNLAMGWTLFVMALEISQRGRRTDALPLYDQALEVTQADPALVDLRLLIQINKAITLGNLDRYEEALTEATQARDLAVQVGTIFRVAQAHGALAQLFFQTGRWDDALAEVSRLPGDLQEPVAACCDLGIAAVISFHRGDAAAARRHLDAAAPYARRIVQRFIGPMTLARSMDLEHDGSPSEALAALAEVFSTGDDSIEESEDLLADAVRLATVTGDLSTAQDLAGQAVALAAGSEIPHQQANALYCRGLLDHNPSRLLAAAERYDDAGRPLQKAKALEAAAGNFADTGDLRQARAAFTRAVEAYASLGAAADVTRLQAASRTRGTRREPHVKHRRAPSSRETLTPAEIVAAFVEAGLSNPEIAAKLLARRTAATLVSHELRCGLTSNA
jgi:tetratricopeptide (TPR) repeat protein